MSSKDKVSEKVQEAIFNQLSTKPGNGECADCNNKSPTWVSLDFGVFVCIRCSGVHRQLGPHITRVRSTRLDGWFKENIEIMATVGNKLANDYYEHNMSSGYRKPAVNSTPEECRRFVDEKYIRKAWAPKGHPEPVKEFVECRKTGTKPNFGFAKGSQATSQVEETPVIHENHRQTTGISRKKSVSLDKLPSKHEHAHQNVDLMSNDDDLLGGGNDANDFGEFKHAHSASPQKKTINFANFKKAQTETAQQQQAQPQSQPQSQTQWAWDLTNAQTNSQAQSSTNTATPSQSEQKPAENKVDLMKLYSQPGPMMQQNQFNQAGMYPQQQWGHMQGNYNNGWNNNMNMNGTYNNGYMGQQNHFQGAYPPQHGGQGFNSNMGYNQVHMNPAGNMGYNQIPATGGYGNNLYQNNSFMQPQNAPNKFF